MRDEAAAKPGGQLYREDRSILGVTAFHERGTEDHSYYSVRANRQLGESLMVEFVIQADQDCLIGLDRRSSGTN